MKVYALNVLDDKQLRKITKLLNKHGIGYRIVLLIASSEAKAKALGGIISKYDLERIKLEDIYNILSEIRNRNH